MPAGHGKATAEAQIRGPVQEQADAIRDKDVDGSLSSYAPAVLLFDVVGPLRSTGSDAARKRLTEWFASFRGPIAYELRDLTVTAGDDTAFCHSLNRVSATTTDGQKLEMWWRATMGLRKRDAAWMITHEHAWVPFYMDGTYSAAVDLKP